MDSNHQHARYERADLPLIYPAVGLSAGGRGVRIGGRATDNRRLRRIDHSQRIRRDLIDLLDRVVTRHASDLRLQVGNLLVLGDVLIVQRLGKGRELRHIGESLGFSGSHVDQPFEECFKFLQNAERGFRLLFRRGDRGLDDFPGLVNLGNQPFVLGIPPLKLAGEPADLLMFGSVVERRHVLQKPGWLRGQPGPRGRKKRAVSVIQKRPAQVVQERRSLADEEVQSPAQPIGSATDCAGQAVAPAHAGQVIWIG
jgi:hypothetical protein